MKGKLRFGVWIRDMGFDVIVFLWVCFLVAVLFWLNCSTIRRELAVEEIVCQQSAPAADLEALG